MEKNPQSCSEGERDSYKKKYGHERSCRVVSRMSGGDAASSLEDQHDHSLEGGQGKGLAASGR